MMVLYLITIISRRAIRDNYLGIPSKYYLFDYTSLRWSDLDEERYAIAVTLSRHRGNCVVTGTFLHKNRKADSGRCGSCQEARDTTTHTITKCLA